MKSREEISTRNHGLSGHTDLHRRPVYLQLRDAFTERIMAGFWKPHAVLPNEIQLASQFAVSVGTIRKVMDDLAALGLVSRYQGRGTFVNDPFKPSGRNVFDPIRNDDGSDVPWDPQSVEVQVGRAEPDEALRLSRSCHEFDVLRVASLHSKQKRVIAHQVCAIPVDLGVDAKASRHATGLSEIYARAGILVQKIEDRLRIDVPGQDISRKLQIDEGNVAQNLTRRFFDEKNHVVGICTSWLVLHREVYTCTQRFSAS